MKNAFGGLLAALTVVVWSGAAYAADDAASWWLSFERKKEVAPAADATYAKECGACHFAYQPGLLPERSWRKLLAADALADHFGDNAELDEPKRTAILDFLVANAADKSYYKRSKKIVLSLRADEAPLRITDVPYIRRKHHEIPENLIKAEQVKSLSMCDACHQRADQGNYDDDTVRIPGYGNWTW
jgi:cytochrome c553